MEIKCQFWPKCGPAVILNYLTRRDSQEDYTQGVCSTEKCFECFYHQLRKEKCHAEENLGR